MADPATVKARLLTTFRDFRIDGVPASGANEPDKGEIRFALGAVADLAAVSTATKAVATKSDLASIPSPSLGDSALVTNDPLGDVTNGNGLYSWSRSSWVWIRPQTDPQVAVKLDPLDKWSMALASSSDLSRNGFFHKDTGVFTPTLSFKCSPLIQIEGGREYRVRSSTAGNAAHAWFDAAGGFIASFGVSQANGSTVVAVAPLNARYVGLSCNANDLANFTARSATGSFNLPALKIAVDQVREARDAAVDAKTAILQSENNALAATVDRLLGRLGNRYAMGNRVLGVGDSTMRGTYGGDTEIGVDGGTLIAARDSWISHMCFSTRQKIARVANCGDIGATVSDILANFDDFVIARKPQTVLISGGTNDAAAVPQTSAAAYRATIEAMIVKARNAGITPILVTPLPSANSPAYSILTAYNAELLDLAGKHNLLYLDLYTYARDPATGGLKAEYSGDGVHPSAAGQKAIGEYAASVLLPLVIGDAPPLAINTTDPRNIAPNPLFGGTPSGSGVAPGWLVSGSLPAGSSASVIERPGVIGKMQRITASSTSAITTIQVTIPAASWAPGDLIEVNGVYETLSPGTAARWLEVSDGRQDRAVGTTMAGSGAFHLRRRVRPGATSLILYLRVAAGEGDLAIGQLMVRNLTREGLDV